MDKAKQIKKLIFTNRYTFEDVSKLLGEPIEKCISIFESYYKTPIPPSLLIVGNEKARVNLKKYISASESVLLYGDNGVGKNISLKQISQELGLEIRRSVPVDESQIIQSFGEAPFNVTEFVFVIDTGSLNKKKYSTLRKYITANKSPIVLVANSKDSINKRVLSELKTVKFSQPGSKEIEVFLRKKYNWDGNIGDVYDPDMRVVISRVLNGIDDKLMPEEEIKSNVLAFNLSCGYTKWADFEKCKEPLWWVIRWLGYNQYKKFPQEKEIQLENLAKLSVIDFGKFVYDERYLRSMLMDLKVSPRRCQFSFPIWPRKIKEEKTEIEKLKKPKKKPVIEKKIEQVDFTQWL